MLFSVRRLEVGEIFTHSLTTNGDGGLVRFGLVILRSRAALWNPGVFVRPLSGNWAVLRCVTVYGITWRRQRNGKFLDERKT